MSASMADKKTEKKDETAIEKVQHGALEAPPDFAPAGDARGRESIGRDDVQLPRVGLAQALSPQVMKNDPKYIKGLSSGEMFNTLTGENYGEGPLSFTVIRSEGARGIEFFPLGEGGGIKDFNVPLNDPRMQFGPDGEKPVATKFYDFLILLLPLNFENPLESLVALSLKSSGLKTARELNTLMMQRNRATFAGKYALTAAQITNKKGTFSVFKVANDGWVDKATYEAASQLFDMLKTKTVKVDREAGDDTFDPAELDKL